MACFGEAFQVDRSLLSSRVNEPMSKEHEVRGGVVREVRLNDGLQAYCLKKMEAIVLDSHVDGYLQNGIEVRSGDCVVDVGANIGLFAIRIAMRFPDSKVIACEPIPPIFGILQANAERHGGGRVLPRNLAVGGEEGILDLTYFPNSPALSTAHPEQWEGEEEMLEQAVKGTAESAPGILKWARFLPSFVHKVIATRMRADGMPFQTPVRPLSAILEDAGVTEVGLLKIDCEGAEWAVLTGVEASLWPRIRQVVIEVHDLEGRLQKVRDLLKQHGFSRQVVEQEQGLEGTKLYNVFALRE